MGTLLNLLPLHNGRDEDGQIQARKFSYSYKGSVNLEILRYVGEPTLSMFSDHVSTPKYTFNMDFTLKIINCLDKHSENMLKHDCLIDLQDNSKMLGIVVDNHLNI